MTELKIKRILFATDFLESSRLALDYAVAFAHHFNANVVLLHAIELSPPAEEAEAITGMPSLSRKAAQARLDGFAAGLRRLGLQVETLLKEGTPCTVITDAEKALAPDLLVLGVHGVHRGVSHLLIGSNAEKILLSAHCPTLSVGAHVLAGLDLSLHLNEILYCTDFTPQSAAAAPYAIGLAQEFGLDVEVCHLAQTPPEQDSAAAHIVAEDYCDALRRTAPGLADPWCTPAYNLRHAMSLDEIVRRAEAATAGLIVLGVHGETQLGRHLHASLAYQLLSRATCPVLSVRADPRSD